MKENRPRETKRMYQKPRVYKWKCPEETEFSSNQRPSESGLDPLVLGAPRALLVTGYAETIDRLLPHLGERGLSTLWEMTSRGFGFWKVQSSAPRFAHSALFLLDFRGDASQMEDRVAEICANSLQLPRAMVLLLRSEDLQRKEDEPWMSSCWQSSQPLSPDALADVVRTFLRVCVPFSHGEAKDYGPMCGVS